MKVIQNKAIEYRIQHTPTWKDSYWSDVKGYFPTIELAYEKIQKLNQSPLLNERKYRILEVETTTKIVDVGIPAISHI
jgi:hypothetical protein